MTRETAGLRGGFRLQRRPIDFGEHRQVGLALAPRHGEPDRFLERVGGAKQQLNDFVGWRSTAAAQMVEQILHAVRQIGDAAVPHRRGHALDRVDRPEQAADRLGRGGIPLPIEQQLIAGAQVLPALGQEQLGVLRQIHRYPSTRWTASSTRDGWNGFTTKSFAPAWIASTTSACWPMALHIRILASGSCLTISRTASMPPMSGITMSMVTRSGLSSRYFSTACVPVSASPTTSNPACARMSVIIVRMKMASSQTRTVWLTARSLRRQNRAQQRRDVQHDEQLAVQSADGPHQRRIDAGKTFAIFQCGLAARQHVHHLVHRKANQFSPTPLLPVPRPVDLAQFEDDRRACRPCFWGWRWGEGREAQRTPPFNDRHQCAADIHEPRHDRGRARDTRRWEARENLPHLIHLGRARQCAHAERKSSGHSDVSASGTPVTGCTNDNAAAWSNCRGASVSRRSASLRADGVTRRLPPKVYSRSPTTGQPMCARCTRIWCVRPVPSRTRSRSAWAKRATSAACVTAWRPPCATVMRFRSLGLRAIGASMSTGLLRRCPHTSAAYTRVTVRRSIAPASRRCARSLFATTSRPEVSRSSRCTMPGRPSVDPLDSSVPRPTSTFTSESFQWPGPGCTTSPAGLSSTARCSSSKTNLRE